MTEHKNDGVKKLLHNYWAVAAIVLAVVLIVVVAYSVMGAGIGEKAAGKKATEFLNNYLAQNGQVGEVNVTGVEKANGMYQVNLSYQGKEIPAVYITYNGKYITSQLIPTEVAETEEQPETSTQTDVPKSDKPTVELFVMSYCPYGTQAEKGILPVLQLLGNKINGNIRFVHYTMHGEAEDTENFRQLCIRETTPALYIKYLSCFLEDANAIRCLKLVNLNEDSCIANKASDYYASDSALSQEYGVQGSPTLVINGVQVQSGRDSASMLNAVCAAFNTAPAECSETLSSESPSAGFGYNSAGDASAASCGT